ncbi:HPF/RaiA family ribosome-associated protein [Thiomicrorhabdus sp. ZW0627]|uniref:HPF/RaiA family ribosome-associated protein n=1 Tax=Thiomicrorhabdus sp. ZW0627 TaxID=3039774 RepID=UPI0024365FE6|nr:HPF/RaiA family ribosome-associated protein [Thiomicrorhabdus sp. ZW0627]MDG6774001.1 HPF/RaiA family ribosome-associated protein [Thiomicrorhabdus sp. ZW0627]
MQVPLQITFKDIKHSDAVEDRIKEKVKKLEQFAREIISCSVVIEAPHRKHQQGNLFSIKINLSVPGHDLVATKNSDNDHTHENMYIALRDAFGAIQRQLQDLTRKQRGKVKLHETAPHGTVKALYPEMDYGTIETTFGREIYFHRNSIVNADFNNLKTGDKVHFAEEMGEEGPQASSVVLEGKHHVV